MSLVSQFFGGTSARKIPLKILVVGGGGGSGGILAHNGNGNVMPTATNNSGGGGGGSVAQVNNYWIGPGTVCPVTVGSGGAAGVGIGSTTLTQGGNGGSSSFQDPTGETFSVLGGGGGGGSSGNPSNPGYSVPKFSGLPGGCGGGAGLGGVSNANGGHGNSFARMSLTFSNIPAYSANSGSSEFVAIDNGYGETGGFPAFPYVVAPATPFQMSGGAGGGYSRVNYPINAQVFDNFYPTPVHKNGILSNITGILTSYGNGGYHYEGGAWTPGMPAGPSPGGIMNPGPGIGKTASANSGSGGVGVVNQGIVPGPNLSYSWGGPGIDGTSGVVVVSYPTAFAAASSFPGASDISPQTPGYRTYQFTSPGSITLP